MVEEDSLNCTVQRLILLFTISLVMILVSLAYGNFKEDYSNLEFSSSARGVSYEVTLTNEDDPAEICLIDGRTDDLLILASDYFYITQGNQLIHSVAVDNSRFEIHQELSGCWNVMREKDSLQVRLINLSESDIFFRTMNSELETRYTEVYKLISVYFLISRVIMGMTLMIMLLFSLGLISLE